MPQEQTVNYKVSVDDSDLQAKLSAMRSSIDMTLGSNGMGGMGFGMSPQSMLGGMGNVMLGSGGANMMGGMADFGSQIRPVSYTPPAIAFQPHFGMISLQQTGGQAALGMTGPIGMGLAHPFSTRSNVPGNISMGEYMALSTRAFAAHAGDAAATGALVAGSTGASLLAGGAGTLAGAALFSSGVGKFVGGFLGGALGGMAVTAYTGEMADMMAQNRAVQQQLSQGSFRFISGGPDVDPLTGRGFSRAARAGIADFVQTQELKDARYGMNEYRQVLESGMQNDLFSGTHDANDFKTKFKALVENVKTVAATLHTSLQEGVEVIRGFRDMGVTDPGQVNRMTMGSELMGRAGGRTGMEMMAIGQAGAEIFRGTGVNMAKGFELNQMNTMQIRQMLSAENPILTRETVGQAGGEVALGQQMTAAALGGFQSALGRGALMANFNPATGGLNPNMISNMAGQDAFSMVQGAAKFANNPMALFTMQANQSKMIGSLSAGEMQAFSVETGMAEARMIAQGMGISGTAAHLEDIFKSQGLRRGISEQVLDTQLAWLHTKPADLAKDQEAAENSMRVQVQLEDFRNRFSGKRIGNALLRTFVQGPQRTLSGMAGAIEQGVDNIGIALGGGNIIGLEATKESIAEGDRLLSANPALGHVVDARGDAYQRIFGGQSADLLGESFSKLGKVSGDTVTFAGGTAKLYGSVEEAQQQHYSGSIIGKMEDGKVMVLSTQELKKVSESMRNNQPSKQAVDAAAKKDLDRDVRLNLREQLSLHGTDYVVAHADEITTKGRTGPMSAEDRAMQARYYADIGGDVGKLYSTSRSTATVADAGGKGRAKFLGSAEQATYAIKDMVSNGVTDWTWINPWAYSHNKTMLDLGKDLPDTVAAVTKAATESEARLAFEDIAKKHNMTLSPEDVAKSVNRIREATHISRKDSYDVREDYAELEGARNVETKESNDVANAATGGKSGSNVPISAVGDFSKEALIQFQALTEANKKTAAILENLQLKLGIK
jgi:hypothetical protein